MFKFLKNKNEVSEDIIIDDNTVSEIIDSSGDKLIEKDLEIEFLNKKIKLLETENINLKSGLATVQTNLAESVGNNKEALTKLSDIDKSFDFIRGESKDILGKVEGVKVNIEKTSKYSSEIDEGVQSILEAIEGISEIALQSKLLSFNASVEAARAGEAGKGFSVVAMEVQRLSDSTSKLLKSIKERTSSFEQIAVELQSSSQQTLSDSVSVIENINHFNSVIADTTIKNKDSLQNIFATNDVVFMGLAKLDHIIWKVNTYLSILREKPMFDFVDHRNCRLGKWYYNGDGKESFSHLQTFAGLDKHHEIVHNGTKQIFDYLENVRSRFDQIIDGVNEMEDASQNVFDGLDRILEEKKSKN